MVTRNKARLGDILISAGLLTPEKLEMALKEQNHTGEKLGKVLSRLGIVTEDALSRLLARQAGVDHVSLKDEWVQREAVELLSNDFAESNNVFPLRIQGKTLVLAMADPLDLATIDEAGRLTGYYIEVVHATEDDITDSLFHHFGSNSDIEGLIDRGIKEASEAQASGLKAVEGDSPYVRLVDLLIQKGIEEKATDIHIEPEEMVLRSRYRIDGRLVQGHSMPKELQSIVLTRFKILSGMNISETRIPQDGRIFFKYQKRKIDLRVSTFPTVHGESIVSRILDKETLSVGIEKLGMSKKMLKPFQVDLTRPNGIILVTGPTGSGKTTTLYSALSYLNKPDVKMITLEDPVEYELPLINQGQIQTKQGFTFAAGLRAILRQDPDILLVGEIRDQETAELAIRAALTGHLVFSTLHTNDAVGAIPRLVEMGIKPYLLSATMVAIVAQRLIRTVCPVCRITTEPSAEQRELLRLDEIEGDPQFSTGKGCQVCKESGYKGRQAVFEYLRVDNEIKELINTEASREEIMAHAVAKGMITLRADTLSKVMKGKTSLDEMMRVVS